MDKKDKMGNITDFKAKIRRYLKEIPPNVLGVINIGSIEILNMTSGAYNLNFHIKVSQKEFIFRINIEQQSGLSDQIKYEYRILKFLQGFDLAPNAYFFDNSLKFFDFGILIEEYLNGPHLSYEKNQIIEVAQLLAKLHSLPILGTNCITWEDPLGATFDFAKNDMLNYEKRKTHDKKVIHLAKELLARAKTNMEDKRHLFKADSINHTDVVCDNFIKTSNGLRMIDWEKPRVDDGTYDISCFLSKPAQLWCSETVLNSADREVFLDTYSKLSGKKKDLLLEKIRIREPLISLHWILWGAIKLCDFKDNRTSPELLAAHEEKIDRYERIANPVNIEKIIESF